MRNKIAAAAGATAVVAAGLVSLGSTAANAVAVTGGCATLMSEGGAIDGTTQAATYFAPNGPWSDEAEATPKGNPPIAGHPDYTLASTNAAVNVGDTREFALTYNKGMLSKFSAVTGTAYWYFSVNGVMLDPIVLPRNVPMGTTEAGATINGSYEITDAGVNEIVFEKIILDSPNSAPAVRVVCNGQTGATPALNPHTTPVATNVKTNFTAVGPLATISSITGQSVLTHARSTDVIAFDVDVMANGTATAELCDTDGANCAPSTSTVTIAGGEGAGTITVPASFSGAKILKVSNGTSIARTPITILGAPTLNSTRVAGGPDTEVPLTGDNWDPNTAVSVSAYKAFPPMPANLIAGSTVTVTANASGNLPADAKITIPAGTPTTYIGATQRAHLGQSALYKSFNFDYSENERIGAGTLKQELLVDVNAGDLTTTQAGSDVRMSAVNLGQANRTSTGNLNALTVVDLRGANAGWSITGQLADLTSAGGGTIPASAVEWTPACAVKTGATSDDTIGTGGVATLASARALCSTTAAGADNAFMGEFTANAALKLTVPNVQRAGAYSGTLTLTIS